MICGSLLTINIFVAHVCPGLLTSRSSKGPSYRQSVSNPPDIVTFGGSGGGNAGGSKKRRDKYSKSNEDGLFPLTTLVNIEGETTGSLHKGGRARDLSDGDSGRGEDAESTQRIVPGEGQDCADESYDCSARITLMEESAQAAPRGQVLTQILMAKGKYSLR